MTETNRQTQLVITAKPNSYIAKNWKKSLPLDELKALFELRCTMEMLL